MNNNELDEKNVLESGLDNQNSANQNSEKIDSDKKETDISNLQKNINTKATNRNRRSRGNESFQEKSMMSSVIFDAKRVTKVTTGGRYFNVAIVAVVGDKNGNVGYGIGKAFDSGDAKTKAIHNAKKNLQHFPLYEDRTILHDVVGKYGTTTILLRKAKVGTSVVSSRKLLDIFNLIGIKDIVVKKLTGSSNPLNTLRAIFAGLESTNRTKFIRDSEAAHTSMAHISK